MTEKSKKIEIGKNVTWKTMGDDKSIILDLDSGNYYTLNETATAAWKILDQGGDLDQVVTTLNGSFNAKAASINEDVNSFTQDITNAGLARWVDTNQPEKKNISLESNDNPIPYAKPTIEQHEAVQQVTAGTGGSSGGNHYWYPN